jgi:anthranilate phosphoribosyltransferase
MESWSETLKQGGELTSAEVASLCEALFRSDIAVEKRAEWLASLARKGETAGEIAAFVRTLLRKGVPFPQAPGSAWVMDVCGTGGDKLGLFNISTAVMFVAAACGVRVVKHGNRGITSKSGGADVLEAAGVRIDLPPEAAAEVLDRAGCVFLFAPLYHPTFREVAPVRQFLAAKGMVTVFNKLGPLLNPARPARQLSGVFQESLVDLYADVFQALGRDVAWAVHGQTPAGGLDELSTMGVTRVREVRSGKLQAFDLDPKEFGIVAPKLAGLLGADAAANARTLEAVLSGDLAGPMEDIVCWNAAACLRVADIADDLPSALGMARLAIRSGAAMERLRQMRDASQAT